MVLIMYAVALVFVAVLAAGWLALICSLVLTTSGVAVSLPVVAVAKIRQRLGPPVARTIADGVLCIEGLAGEVRLASRLRTGLVRVLEITSPETNPRACACVKKVDAVTPPHSSAC